MIRPGVVVYGATVGRVGESAICKTTRVIPDNMTIAKTQRSYLTKNNYRTVTETSMSAEPAIQTTELQGDRGGLCDRYFDLFLISFLILFFELASIRWFGSTSFS